MARTATMVPSLFQLGIAIFFVCAKLTYGSNGGDKQGFRVELTHWDSPSVRDNDKSLVERLNSMVAWSNDRVAMHSQKIHKKHTGYQSQVSPSSNTGAYLMDIAVGTPPKSFKVIADTGSDLVWLKIATPCLTCNDTIFEMEQSKTYKAVKCSSPICQEDTSSICFPNLISKDLAKQCVSSYAYGGGAVAAYMGTDTISLRSSSSMQQHYQAFHKVLIGGGVLYSDGLLGNNPNIVGIAGLGQGPISLTTQLGKAIQNKFSYCLVDLLNASKSSPLLFGDAAKLSGEGIQSTPIIPYKKVPTYYVLELQGVQAGGELVTVSPNQTTIIDSGTTLTYLDKNVYSKVIEIFKSSIKLPIVDVGYLGYGDQLLCYNISGNKDYKFPPLSLEFLGATLDAPKENYLYHWDEQGDVVCIALTAQEGFNIIGNIMQQNFHILYDRDAAMLSFVPAQCDKI